MTIEYWTEEHRRRREQTMRNKGLHDMRELRKTFPSVQKRFPLGMEDKYCSKHLGIYIEETFILPLFDNIEPTLHKTLEGAGYYDWKDINGLKYKHIASRPKERPWQYGGNDYFEWNIAYNRNPDHFILSGWDKNYNPLYLWDIKKEEVIRGRLFWSRDAFSIVNTERGRNPFEKYIMKDKLIELIDLITKNR